MKRNDPDAARVWQRILPPGAQEQQSIQLLMRQLSADLAYLQRSAKTEDRLLREYAEQLHCLKGLLILSGGPQPRNTPGSPPDHSLSRCFDHALQRLGAYQLRSADPVYGPVFRDLARQTEHHCRQITELLGSR